MAFGFAQKFVDEQLVSDARLGVFYTAVEISAGDAGVASTPRDLSDTVRVMAGPTAPQWPFPIFRRGESVLGGIRVLNATDLLTIVGQGGSGYLFEKAAEKMCVIDPSIDVLATAEKTVDDWPLDQRALLRWADDGGRLVDEINVAIPEVRL